MAMPPADKRILLFSARLTVLLTLAFAVMIFLPQHAHHLLLLIALILSLVSASALLEYRRQVYWKKTRARVDGIRECEQAVAIGKTSRLTYYYPQIEYAYVVDGTSYTGTLVSIEKENVWIAEFDDWGAPIPEHQRWWRSIQAGDEIQVYVNPYKPQQAVLVNSISRDRRSHHLALLIGGIILALVWLLLMAYGLTLPAPSK